MNPSKFGGKFDLEFSDGKSFVILTTDLQAQPVSNQGQVETSSCLFPEPNSNSMADDDFIDVVSNVTDNNFRVANPQRSVSLDRMDHEAVPGIRDSAFQPVFPARTALSRQA